MNAYEMADALDWVCENHLTGIGDADFKATATMLRQQQAEIERLKALCITYIDDEWSGTSSYQAKIDEVNNERK